mmetsp:Transcript_16686/g.25205  ORF Transcript_16686/g.25205 Transcript_16686/m.25205 type:complete len:511 (-) Transcript_16686:248-1780(-)
MSFSTGSQSTSSPRAKCDQVIFEAMAKAAEIIVHSRNPSPRSSNMSARFNLCVPEIAELRQSLQHHRQSLHLPLRLEVRSKNQQLVERWSLAYNLQETQPIYGDPIVQLRHVCKKIVIWLRTLYCWTRMLPSYCLRGPDLLYRLEVCEGHEADVPYFSFIKSPEVATPYGVLQYKVWYASQITKPTTKPIPIAFSTHKNSSSPVLAHAKSLPVTRDNNILQNQKPCFTDPSHNDHQPASLDRSHHLQRRHSNVESHRMGGLERSLSLERSSHSARISHRSALHDPPTYAYNDTPTRTTSNGNNSVPDNSVPAALSSSPAMFSCSTPPTVPATPPLSSTPPTIGFLLPPAGLQRPNTLSVATTPPFSGLPHELAAAANQQQEEKRSIRKPESELLPISSLDLLHSSPFHKTTTGLMSSAFSSFNGGNESDWLRNSMLPVENCKHEKDDGEDMPFAVDDDDKGAVSMGDIRFAAKADAPHLSLFDGTTQEDELQSLSKQLQEFKAFGATLTS